MNRPLPSDHPLRHLALGAWHDPERWTEMIESAPSDLLDDPDAQQLLSALEHRVPLATDPWKLQSPLGFLVGGLIWELKLAQSSVPVGLLYKLGLSVLNEDLHDVRCTGIRARIGEQVMLCKPSDASPYELAFLYLNTGNAHAQSPFGSRADDLERAILCYEEALRQIPNMPDSVRKLEYSSKLHTCLGNVHAERAASWSVGNFDRAIACHEKSLRDLEDYRPYCSHSRYLGLRGQVFNNLGNAHRDRPLREGELPEANLQTAIQCFEQSLEARADQPLAWAETQRNLGTVYLACEASEPADIQEAITCFERALEIYEFAEVQGSTKPHPASLWQALSHKLLGVAHFKLGTLLPGDHFDNAKVRFEEAVRRYSQLGMRREQISAYFDWGRLEMDAGKFAEGLELLQQAAIRADEEVVLGQSVTARSESGSFYARVFESLLACAAMAAENIAPAPSQFADVAAFWAERSRARVLSDWIQLRDETLPTGAIASLAADHHAALLELRDLDDRLQRAQKEPVDESSLELRHQRAVLMQRNGRYSGGRSIPLHTDEMQHLAQRTQRGLLTLRSTFAGICAVYTPPSGPTKIRRLRSISPADFEELVDEWRDGYQAIRSLRNLAWFDRAFAQPEALDSWKSTQEHVLGELGDTLGRELVEWLSERVSEMPAKPRPLTVLPGPGFHLLPMHAAFWETGGTRTCLDDFFVFNYAPSCSVLASCVERQELIAQPPADALIVANPTGNLNYDLPEFDALAREVAKLFAKACVLGKTASQSADAASFSRLMGQVGDRSDSGPQRAELERWPIMLLATHGVYDVDRPWSASGIEVASSDNDTRQHVTLADVFQLDLSQLWLVVLAACETAISEEKDLTGEQLGLPMALIAAGAMTAIGSLWEVDSRATALLMIRFISELLGNRKLEPGHKSLALWRARQWLRTAGRAEIIAKLKELAPAQLIHEDLPEQPYAHPFFWSAFACYGAA